MDPRSYLLLLAVTVSVISGTYGLPGKRPVCGCICPSINKLTLCDTVAGLIGEVHANVEQLRMWARYRNFVQDFSHNWREEIADIVETTIKDYISKGKLHGKPEDYAEKEDLMLNDSTLVARPIEEDNNLAKNVSSLLEKVELVENRTMVVENELKTERRVRRDLEEKVNKTHTSLVLIEDQLLNVSVPVDAMVTQVEMRLISSIEDLNKTIYEDHLKKLYTKVDGVVYKDETKKLGERLDSIEGELQGSSNASIVSIFAEEIKHLEENVYHLNSSIGDFVVPGLQTLNNSIGEILIPRIETLELETVRKDAAEELEDKMNGLINVTEQFKTALVDVLSNAQDVQDLEKKFQDFSEQLIQSLETMQKQIEDLKNETIVKHDIDDDGEVIEISRIVQQTTEDYIETEDGNNDGREVETFYTTESEDIAATELEMNDVKTFESNDITTLESNDISTFESNDITTFGSNNITTFESNEITESETIVEEETSSEPYFIIDEDRSRIGKDLESNSTDCEVPVINDPHLLVDVERNGEGKPALKFGCKPIGRYRVPTIPVPPRCENGSWRTPIPSCIELPSENAINSLAEELLKEHPCKTSSGEVPDPTNCTRFFKCAHGQAHAFPCPPGLLFNANLTVCDFARAVKCYTVKSKHVEELQALIPPIHIAPDRLDKKYSLLATGKTGELIIHPRSSFTLHCLYPDNMYGDPQWSVIYHQTEISPKLLKPTKGVNRISLTVTAAKEEDSGVYRCVTPFGLHHDVKVIVKAVVCPALPEEEEYEDVFYRPTPEGELRILGTTAEVQCEEGHSVVAQCMANGEWFTESTIEQECTPKKRQAESTWNCKPLDLSQHPDLVTERFDDEKIIAFKCAGRMRLFGDTFTRCLADGTWSHRSLPKCKN